MRVRGCHGAGGPPRRRHGSPCLGHPRTRPQQWPCAPWPSRMASHGPACWPLARQSFPRPREGQAPRPQRCPPRARSLSPPSGSGMRCPCDGRERTRRSALRRERRRVSPAARRARGRPGGSRRPPVGLRSHRRRPVPLLSSFTRRLPGVSLNSAARSSSLELQMFEIVLTTVSPRAWTALWQALSKMSQISEQQSSRLPRTSGMACEHAQAASRLAQLDRHCKRVCEAIGA
mmetsp:Transcript_98903/g.304823  ORF Transcript_98903/g.304823 Transcript_98903/m.304823 type:complete len:232 (+) Transcript_98903:85-780(+)